MTACDSAIDNTCNIMLRTQLLEWKSWREREGEGEGKGKGAIISSNKSSTYLEALGVIQIVSSH